MRLHPVGYIKKERRNALFRRHRSKHQKETGLSHDFTAH